MHIARNVDQASLRKEPEGSENLIVARPTGVNLLAEVTEGFSEYGFNCCVAILLRSFDDDTVALISVNEFQQGFLEQIQLFGFQNAGLRQRGCVGYACPTIILEDMSIDEVIVSYRESLQLIVAVTTLTIFCPELSAHVPAAFPLLPSLLPCLLALLDDGSMCFESNRVDVDEPE
jgi:hypothetical protein